MNDSVFPKHPTKPLDRYIIHAKRRILIVDDSAVNRKILCRILNDEYETLQAENGREALDILERERDNVSLILLDIVMPVMDGHDFLENYKRDPNICNIPVIVTTQKDGENDEVMALSCGAADFLAKPYKQQIIKHRVANIISLRETAAIANIMERDSLTGLYGKEFFYRKAKTMLDQNPNLEFDLICCDIENFKLVNDVFGVETGDALLQYLGATIKKRTGDFGICGRIGADVFAALALRPRAYSDMFFSQANSELNQFPIQIHLSAKYGIYPVEDRSIAMYRMCDWAQLAIASIKGKYDVDHAFYNEQMRQVLLSEQFIIGHMNDALLNHEFQIYLQPKHMVNTGRVAGAEALIRWIHPEKGMLLPGVFIPLFEKNGFIFDLDQYVWNETCRLIRMWMDEGRPVVPVSVNVSRKDIYHKNLPQLLMDILEKYGLKPENLHLEITETAYTENAKQLIEVVSELKSRGFVIEMDDFGTGYSSLNMLSELPIDVLKLDIKFIQNGVRMGGKNVLNFIVSLAKWLNLQVVAEGVETEEQLEILKGMDCNIVQGYYFSRPMPQDDFIQYLNDQKVETVCKGIGSSNYEATCDQLAILTDQKVMLIVDALEINRNVLAMIFRKMFYIVEADNGADAVRYLQDHFENVAVILLNLAMPTMDGDQVIAYMQGNEKLRKIPVVVTAQVSGNSEIQGLSTGAADMISKPYSADAALRRVENLLAGAQNRQKSTMDKPQ
ncbi:MAG: EAL domain-containing protein [Clostridia bacterium]